MAPACPRSGKLPAASHCIPFAHLGKWKFCGVYAFATGLWLLVDATAPPAADNPIADAAPIATTAPAVARIRSDFRLPSMYGLSSPSLSVRGGNAAGGRALARVIRADATTTTRRAPPRAATGSSRR